MVRAAGFEPGTACIKRDSQSKSFKDGNTAAVHIEVHGAVPPDLVEVVEAWIKLSAECRSAVVDLVRKEGAR
jgi:hypothetical protein